MALTDTSVKWGIIGPGRIARKFATDLAGVPGAELYAVASSDIRRAQSFAAEFGVQHVYGSYNEMVHCPGLQVVYIATPHAFHMEQALICLEAGISVLCEKPMALNADQVRRMTDAAKRYETFLMEAIWSRFLPTTKKILELIAAGTIGRVTFVKADFGFRSGYDPAQRTYHPSLGGGALLDIGIYPLFLATLLMGIPERVHAVAHVAPTGVDETVAAVLSYAGGGIAMMDATFAHKTPTEAFIYGDNGGCIHVLSRFHGPNEGFTLTLPDRETEFFLYEWDNLGYRYEILEVMQCLREGKKESDLLPLTFSQTLIGIMDEIRRQTGVVYPGE